MLWCLCPFEAYQCKQCGEKTVVMYAGKWWQTYCLSVQHVLQTIVSALLKVTETKYIKNPGNIFLANLCRQRFLQCNSYT